MSEVDVLILHADGSAPQLQKWQRSSDTEVEEVTFEALSEVLGEFESYYLGEDLDIFVSECPDPDQAANTQLIEAMLQMKMPVYSVVRGVAVIHLRQGSAKLPQIKAWLETREVNSLTP